MEFKIYKIIIFIFLSNKSKNTYAFKILPT